MIKPLWRKFVVGLFVAASYWAMSTQAQEVGPAYRYIDRIHLVDSDTAVIDARGRQYAVSFRNICQVGAFGEFFVLDRFQLGQTVTPGDVFQSSGSAAPCVVESVTEMPNVLQQSRNE